MARRNFSPKRLGGLEGHPSGLLPGGHQKASARHRLKIIVAQPIPRRALLVRPVGKSVGLGFCGGQSRESICFAQKLRGTATVLQATPS